jgi:hypothetical protein
MRTKLGNVGEQVVGSLGLVGETKLKVKLVKKVVLDAAYMSVWEYSRVHV